MHLLTWSQNAGAAGAAGLQLPEGFLASVKRIGAIINLKDAR